MTNDLEMPVYDEPVNIPRSITVIGKRWFQRSYGNTYHSVSVYVDGEFIGAQRGVYGYGDAYMQTAAAIVRYVYPDLLPDTSPLWHLRDTHGIKLVSSVADVARERDL